LDATGAIAAGLLVPVTVLSVHTPAAVEMFTEPGTPM
jgi:hypothetical protein